MNKKTLSYIFFVFSIILIIGFVIRCIYDYSNVYAFGSAPFWVYILQNAVYMLVPAAAFAVIGAVNLKNNKKK